MPKIDPAAQIAAVTKPRSRLPRYLGPAVLAALLGAIALIVVASVNRPLAHRSSAARHERTGPAVPPYWIVHPGDTLTEIALRTGLSVAQLEAFNPNTDPNALNPGQRLNLWLHPPRPQPPPPGPEFWTVRPGQSFGSIAAKTGVNLSTLEQLNPQLKPSALQPGDSVRLRR